MTRWQANSVLLFVALIWGTTFVAQQWSAQDVGALTYTGLRFILGALVVLPWAWREHKRRKAQEAPASDRRDVLRWAGLGVLLFLGAVFQQLGVAQTTVSNSAFLTALYVPMVPILGWLLGHGRPGRAAWWGAGFCVLGTYGLSGGSLSALNLGDWWVLLSTLFWTAHVVYVGRVAAQSGAPLMLAFVQFAACGLLSLLLAPFWETITLTGVWNATPEILYGGLLSVGLGFTLQVVAQRHADAAQAAILLSSEIVFAALAGALVLGERLGGMQWAGSSLILLAIVGVQMAPWLAVRRAARVS